MIAIILTDTYENYILIYVDMRLIQNMYIFFNEIVHSSIMSNLDFR